MKRFACFATVLLLSLFAQALADFPKPILRVLEETKGYRLETCYHLINGGSIRVFLSKEAAPQVRIGFDPIESDKVTEDVVWVAIGDKPKVVFTRSDREAVTLIRQLVSAVYHERRAQTELPKEEGGVGIQPMTRIEKLAMDGLLTELDSMLGDPSPPAKPLRK